MIIIKKCLLSLFTGFVFCFVCVTSCLAPTKINAEVDWSYYGFNIGMPYNWTDFSAYPGYDNRTANLFVHSVGKSYLILTNCFSNSTGDFVAIYTIDYDTVSLSKNSTNNSITLYFTDTYYYYCTFNTLKSSISASGGNFNGSNSRAPFSITIPSTFVTYVSDKYINDSSTKLDIVRLTKDLLSNFWDDGTVFGDNYDMTGFLPFDLWSGKWADTINNVGNDFLDYFKTLLGIDNKVSSSDFEQILYDIDTNNYDTNNYLVNIDTDKRTQLNTTWNNYKRFINNSVTYDTINNVYKPNTSYLNTVYNNSNYFQTCILGDSLNTFDIVSALNVISNQLDTTIFNALADINTNVTALGGIFANAINSAFADFKLNLDNIIGKINISLKNIDDGITIGNSISTAINNTINPDSDSSTTTFVDRINLSFKALGDKITKELGNINVNIKNITDNSTGTPAPIEDDFWKEVRKVLSDKIPLYKQCVDLISPLTSVTYSQVLDSHDDYLLDDTSAQNEISMQSLSLLSDDSQIDISYLSGLVIITYDTNSAPVGLKIPFIKSDWGIDSYIIDTTTYTSSKYKSIISDILLTICYVGFAWSVVHRISVWFGHTRSDDK